MTHLPMCMYLYVQFVQLFLATCNYKLHCTYIYSRVQVQQNIIYFINLVKKATVRWLWETYCSVIILYFLGCLPFYRINADSEHHMSVDSITDLDFHLLHIVGLVLMVILGYLLSHLVNKFHNTEDSSGTRTSHAEDLRASLRDVCCCANSEEVCSHLSCIYTAEDLFNSADLDFKRSEPWSKSGLVRTQKLVEIIFTEIRSSCW